MEYIITFENTHFAILSERHLLGAGLAVNVLPLPSQLSAGCGICLRLKPQIIGEALKALKALEIGKIGLYKRNADDEKNYEEVGDRENFIKGVENNNGKSACQYRQ